MICKSQFQYLLNIYYTPIALALLMKEFNLDENDLQIMSPNFWNRSMPDLCSARATQQYVVYFQTLCGKARATRILKMEPGKNIIT